MGFLLETSANGGDVASLAGRADAAARALPGTGFCRDLDAKKAALPAPPAGCDRVVVLGIGGSALGARTVHEACGAGRAKPLVVVDNVDPRALEAAWRGGDPARTAWVAVSKSGTTTETLAQFAIVRERLRAAGKTAPLCVVTGGKGPLLELARKERLPVYDVPEEVGGRYSVFTPAATVPLALAGLDAAALLDGARRAREGFSREGSAASRIAAFFASEAMGGRNVVALWCYAERLEPLGEWFRQLWAESLGKRRADGARVGQTPIHCVGSTDQHSVQQLMVEGPLDRAVLVLCGPADFDIGTPGGEGSGAGAGRTLGQILDAMRRATSAEMVRAGNPLLTARLEDWSERSMGALLMTLLGATVVAGALLGVDPFGQPGVEAAKLATKELLAKPGGDVDRAIARLLGEGGGLRCG